jgi:hypothetical protein
MLEGTVGYHKAILMVKILLILRRAFDCLLTSAASGCTRWRIGSTVGVVSGRQLSARRQLLFQPALWLARRSKWRSADTGATMQSRQTGGSSP